jgi:isochorismate hydrolase
LHRRVWPAPGDLETAARAVLELKELQFYFGNSGSSDNPEYQISLLRQLRENFSQLRAMCEAEAGLIIPPVAFAQPFVEEPIAEYEPASGNQLGSLAEAVTR